MKQQATNNRQLTRRKASDIYKKQNILIHKAMSAAGLPYKENKEMWLDLMNEIRAQGPGRRAQGEKPRGGTGASPYEQQTTGNKQQATNTPQGVGYL